MVVRQARLDHHMVTSWADQRLRAAGARTAYRGDSDTILFLYVQLNFFAKNCRNVDMGKKGESKGLG
jgi:hypothetical protein